MNAPGPLAPTPRGPLPILGVSIVFFAALAPPPVTAVCPAFPGLAMVRQFGSSRNDYGRCLSVNSATGRIAIGGSTNHGEDAAVSLLDVNGTELWSRTFGSGYTDYFNGIAVNPTSGNIAVGGHNGGPNGHANCIMALYTAEGACSVQMKLWVARVGSVYVPATAIPRAAIDFELVQDGVYRVTGQLSISI